MPAPRLTLEVVEIERPCAVPWESMAGDDLVRFCGRCRKNVYNLSALTRREAVRLIVEKEGEFCAKLLKRADGTVVTRECVAVRVGRGVTAAVRLTLASLATVALFVVGRSSETVRGWFGAEPKQVFNQVGEMCLRSPGWLHRHQVP